MADIFQTTFSNAFLEWKCLNFEYSLKFIPKGPIDNNTALVQMMAWHRTGDKPLSESVMVMVGDAYMRHAASMSQNVCCPLKVHWAILCKAYWAIMPVSCTIVLRRNLFMILKYHNNSFVQKKLYLYFF